MTFRSISMAVLLPSLEPSSNTLTRVLLQACRACCDRRLVLQHFAIPIAPWESYEQAQRCNFDTIIKRDLGHRFGTAFVHFIQLPGCSDFPLLGAWFMRSARTIGTGSSRLSDRASRCKRSSFLSDFNVSRAVERTGA